MWYDTKAVKHHTNPLITTTTPSSSPPMQSASPPPTAQVRVAVNAAVVPVDHTHELIVPQASKGDAVGAMGTMGG